MEKRSNLKWAAWKPAGSTSSRLAKAESEAFNKFVEKGERGGFPDSLRAKLASYRAKPFKVSGQHLPAAPEPAAAPSFFRSPILSPSSLFLQNFVGAFCGDAAYRSCERPESPFLGYELP